MEFADNVYTQPLLNAYYNYRVSDADIDSIAYHLLRGRMLLGLFDDQEKNPYNKISRKKVGCKEHQELALETARQSLVLLKNGNNFLPINPKKSNRSPLLESMPTVVNSEIIAVRRLTSL